MLLREKIARERAAKGLDGLTPSRFQAFKVSTDGRHIKRAHVYGLTFEQARDVSRFPLGRLDDGDGQGPYQWSYSLMAEYC